MGNSRGVQRPASRSPAPGATNLLTGLWDANVDRSPVLALTGQVNTQVLGPGAFQEVPLDRMVLHEITDEVQEMPGLEDPPARPMAGRISSPLLAPLPVDTQRTAKLIEGADHPVIVVGNGARRFVAEVIALAEMLDVPTITTFKAKGMVGDDHPLACGTLGRSGTRVAAATMSTADVLLVLGASFSNHTGISEKKTTIQVDADRMVLGKLHPVDLPIWADIGVFLQALQATTTPRSHAGVRAAVAERWSDWRTEKRRRSALSDDRGSMHPAKIFEVLGSLMPANAVIAVDVGNNTYAFGHSFESKGGQDVLMSGYLGSIGFALPAALGAFAAPRGSRPIVLISGDSGLRRTVRRPRLSR